MLLSNICHWPYGLGRQAEEGEPEDLHGCSRTVFGAKIMCGLILSINPRSCKQTGDFFLGAMGTIGVSPSPIIC
jgi:hypothetical protein